jgi:small subunit ribosomal protein S4
MKYTGPKVRLSRRLGHALTPRAAKVMDKHGTPPGQHGGSHQRGRAKMSDYKRQLIQKQLLRAQYNVHERQLSNYYKKATKKSGNMIDNFVAMLETRLDAVVNRGGLTRTIYAARQVVSHGHIQVNGKRVNIASFNVKIGDVVSVREKSRKIQLFWDSVKPAQPPEYLELSKPELTVELKALPIRDEVPIICEVPRVIEYYSR